MVLSTIGKDRAGRFFHRWKQTTHWFLVRNERYLWEQCKNMRSAVVLLFLLTLAACKNKGGVKTHYPSQAYQYVTVDTANLPDKHRVYVPVYSHIYMEDGSSTYNLSATLSIRNTSFTDSFFVTDVVYYGSQGEVLKKYLDSVVLVKPMASIEFVVERMESKGGAGANFVVGWGANKPAVSPLIQTVMTQAATGISFVTNGVEMK